MQDKLRVQGRWQIVCRNPDGSEAWREDFLNSVVTAALNDILSVYFASGTQKPNWFLGLVDNAGFTAFASTDSMLSHPGWSENTQYSAGNRPAWTPGTPSGGTIINPTPATITMSASANIRGAFLTSDNTKGGTAGTLWAQGAFSGVQAVSNGQVLSLQYTCPLTAT